MMRPAFLRGRGVDLVPVDEGDEAAASRFAWRCLSSNASGDVVDLVAADAMGVLVGQVRIEAIDWVARDAHVAARWAGAEPLLQEAVRLVTTYALAELNLDRLTAATHPLDAAAAAALEAAGWRRAEGDAWVRTPSHRLS